MKADDFLVIGVTPSPLVSEKERVMASGVAGRDLSFLFLCPRQNKTSSSGLDERSRSNCKAEEKLSHVHLVRDDSYLGKRTPRNLDRALCSPGDRPVR